MDAISSAPPPPPPDNTARPSPQSPPAAPAAPRDHVDLSEEAVHDMAHIADPLARNEAITQTYHDQSERMGRMLGGRVNWETMAQHASAEVRHGINGDDIPSAMKWALNRLPGGQDVMRHSQDELAAGNQRVFEDIAPQYARFMDSFDGDTHRDDAKLQRFLDRMGPDQQLLKDGFRNYYNAMFETDPHKKDEDVLLGNLQISLRDQTLLQPYISGAIPPLLRPYASSNLIQLHLPDQTLPVGQNVPPANTAGITNPSNPDLQRLLHQLGGDTLTGTGASDWTNLSQRMRFISALFASHANDASLFNAPSR